MSFAPNHDESREQNWEGCTVEVVSPFQNNVQSFDNPSQFPDLELVVGGLGQPLTMHRKILADASERLKQLLLPLRGTGEQRLTWPFDTSSEVDRMVLVKALRFCYGETMSVGVMNGECCAMIATLKRLQVQGLDSVVSILCKFANEESKKNVEVGVELLKACSRYIECCDENGEALNKTLARIVLTKENLFQHYPLVVEKCLMMLPQEYLSLTEYGESHTLCSEFHLKMLYMKEHSKEMNMDEKQALLKNLEWSSLNSQELRYLKEADIIVKDALLEAHEKALERLEIENQKNIGRADRAEAEKEEFKGNAERAKREMEETMTRVEKERDEFKKRAQQEESEKDKQIREIARMQQENQQMEEKLKNAEKERNENMSRLGTTKHLETPAQGNRLLLINEFIMMTTQSHMLLF